MPILKRLRLGSVGCSDARFDPLDLELVGEDERLRHTVLFLENGGGKTSLIALVLLLLNPKVARLGKTDRGEPRLESDYVRPDETGVVLAEWLPDEPTAGKPKTIVTLMALERFPSAEAEGGARGAARKGFVRAILPPGVDAADALSLGQLLPRDVRRRDGRSAMSVDALLRRARELRHAHPEWDVEPVPGNEPGRWLRELQSVGISPEIGRLLARMNLEEGGVAEALTFSSSREFVAHASRLLAPADEIVEPFHAQLRSFAASFRAEAGQVRTRDEIARVRPLWVALADREAEYRAALSAFKDAARDLRALEVGVAGALPEVERARTAVEEEKGRAVEQVHAAEEAVDRAKGEERALSLAVARAELRAAEAAEMTAKKAVEVATATYRRARALLPAVRLRAAESRMKALRAAIEARTEGLADVIARRDALALALAALAKEKCEALSDRISVARAREGSLESACTTREREVRALTTRLGALEAEAENERCALEAAEGAFATLHASGAVGTGEAARAALERHRSEAARLASERADLEEAKGRALLASAAAKERAKGSADTIARLAGERKAAEDRLAAHRQACAVTVQRLRAGEVPGIEPSHALPGDGDRLRELVLTAERDATLRASEAATLRARLAETVRHLEAAEALPPSPDQRRVLERGGGAAEPALPYLRASFGAAAEAAIAAEPGFVHAVVVSKPEEAERLARAAGDLELRLDVPVPVFAAADLKATRPADAPAGARARAIIGLGPHVRDDVRERVLEIRRAELVDATGRERDLMARHQELAILRTMVEATLAAHGLPAHEAAAAEIRRLDDALRAAQGEFSAARDEAAREERKAADLGARIATVTEGERRSGALAERVEDWIERHGEAYEEGPERISRLLAERAEATAARDHLDVAEKADRQAIAEARDERLAAERELHSVEADRAAYAGSVSRGEARPAPLASEDAWTAHAEWEALDRQIRGGDAELRAKLEAAIEESQRHRFDLDRIARGDAATVMRELDPLLDEAGATEAEEADARSRDEQKAEHGRREADVERARKAARGEEDALGRLAPRPAAAARALAPALATLDLEQLRASLAAAPERRVALERAHEEATVASRRAEEGARAARSLEKSWRDLVSEAGEAWQLLRLEDFGRDAAAIEGIVRGDANCQVILDPASQLEPLRRELRKLRGAIQTRRNALAAGQQGRLQAAQEAVAAAEKSDADFVRRAAEIQVAPGREGAERDRARLVGLAERAEMDLRLLDDQLESLGAKLAALAKDQDMIATGLSDEVGKLHERLRDLERLSVLPAGLDAWSGKQFLKLDIPVAEHATRVEALRRWIADRAARDPLPGPRELFPAALEASMLGEPSASIPKAHRFDEFRRRPIQQLSKDSGGEGLTGAFILYCLLARVVTNRERRAGARRVSLALLDNPTGKASKFDFVEAQCRVAAAFGIQYVAATGVADLSALERFERLITLRNPAQQRVIVDRVEDQADGRTLAAVLFARDEVLPLGVSPVRSDEGRTP